MFVWPLGSAAPSTALHPRFRLSLCHSHCRLFVTLYLSGSTVGSRITFMAFSFRAVSYSTSSLTMVIKKAVASSNGCKSLLTTSDVKHNFTLVRRYRFHIYRFGSKRKASCCCAYVSSPLWLLISTPDSLLRHIMYRLSQA